MDLQAADSHLDEPVDVAFRILREIALREFAEESYLGEVGAEIVVKVARDAAPLRAARIIRPLRCSADSAMGAGRPSESADDR